MLLQMFYYETFNIFFNKLQIEELTKSNYEIIEMTANGCLKNDQHTGSRKKIWPAQAPFQDNLQGDVNKLKLTVVFCTYN